VEVANALRNGDNKNQQQQTKKKKRTYGERRALSKQRFDEHGDAAGDKAPPRLTQRSGQLRCRHVVQ
jgi:hypothetical protein